MAPRACTPPKAYFGSVQMLTHFPLLSSKAGVSAINSAFWAEILEQNVPDSITSWYVVTEYTESHFLLQTKLLPE